MFRGKSLTNGFLKKNQTSRGFRTVNLPGGETSWLKLGNHDNNTNDPSNAKAVSNSFIGINADFKISPGANQNFGIETRLQPVGSGGTYFVGGRFEVDNRHSTATTASMVGVVGYAHPEATVASAIGGQFSANKGNLNGTDLVIGVVGLAGGYPGGASYIGVQGRVTQTLDATPTPLIELLHGYLQRPVSGGFATEVRGLSISRWIPASTSHAAETSKGIYIDTSIDIGTAARYAIHSESTAMSVFNGDIRIEDEFNGVVLRDRTNGNRYRLFVDNGTLGVENIDAD